ncbi:hypothetical protein LY76DRAFT_633125 [Colletotrichum caudatum]|nr:hypothetical protein LY76DRAFT_633125 [Colletotrichum caudatum]
MQRSEEHPTSPNHHPQSDSPVCRESPHEVSRTVPWAFPVLRQYSTFTFNAIKWNRLSKTGHSLRQSLWRVVPKPPYLFPLCYIRAGGDRHKMEKLQNRLKALSMASRFPVSALDFGDGRSSQPRLRDTPIQEERAATRFVRNPRNARIVPDHDGERFPPNPVAYLRQLSSYCTASPSVHNLQH